MYTCINNNISKKLIKYRDEYYWCNTKNENIVGMVITSSLHNSRGGINN